MSNSDSWAYETHHKADPQREQDIVNMERPIQDFLGWALALDEKKFIAVLERDGHHALAYQAEKWKEFQQNKLAYLWNWTPAFVSAWTHK